MMTITIFVCGHVTLVTRAGLADSKEVLKTLHEPVAFDGCNFIDTNSVKIGGLADCIIVPGESMRTVLA
ncbi:MAG: hypothetical protein CME80_12065 [Halomonas sp.]|nr:hypothetical protein [Halomonas sp.]